MNRTALFAALLAAMPLVGLVHAGPTFDQPAPFIACQTPLGDQVHHYLPPSSPFAASADGNTQDCDNDPFTLNDYDGEVDHGYGGVQLFADTGDSFSYGTSACFGGAVGHHGSVIRASEWGAAWGPQLIVTSDYSRIPPAEGPDCGDSLVEPCDPSPPEPSVQPFPLNVVIDTVNGLLYTLFQPGGDGCNSLDRMVRCASTDVAPTVCSVGGPGVDGSYFVFVESDLDAGRIPVWGHVWS